MREIFFSEIATEKLWWLFVRKLFYQHDLDEDDDKDIP